MSTKTQQQSRTALYRFYDGAGDLLYVGISVRPWSRWKQHKGQKDWAEDVATSTMEWFDTRKAALNAEREAIVTEEPRYNVVHNSRRAGGWPRLTVICTGCAGEIADGQGVIECDWHAANRLMDNRAAREAENRARNGGLLIYGGPNNPWGPVFELSDDVPWAAYHYDCDPFPEKDTYWFAVERCRSLADLFGWIGHLAEKEWVGHTTWMECVRSLARNGGIFRLDQATLGPMSA